MTEFIPIKIIAKRRTQPSDDYIIRVLDMVTLKTYPAIASSDEILEFDLTPVEVLTEYLDYSSGEKFRPHLISEYLKTDQDDEAELLYEDTKFYHFDRSRPSMRSINYSLKRDKKLFVPCIFKHPDHELIESKWGKYVDIMTLGPDLKLPGYVVTSKKEFDNYILKIETLVSRYNPEEYKNVLMSEFKDYLHSLDEEPEEIICKFKSGKELVLKIDD